MTAPAHPMQPVVVAPDGVHRFKQNAIVRHLLDHGSIDMNQLACGEFSEADREQFVQLIGYSVSGTSTLEYVSDAVYTAACEQSVALDKTAAPPSAAQASPVYGCHNRPRPTAETSYVAQTSVEILRDGFGAPWRQPVYVDIKHTMSTNCRYDLSAADQRCAGCAHGSRP